MKVAENCNKNEPCIFNGPMKLKSNPVLTLTNPLFHRSTASVVTTRLIISTCWFPMAVGIALDVSEEQIVHHANKGGFHLLALECRKCDTSHILITPRATPAANGYRKEHHIQPIRIKKMESNRF